MCRLRLKYKKGGVSFTAKLAKFFALVLRSRSKVRKDEGEFEDAKRREYREKKSRFAR